MNFPAELKYTKSHEWVKRNGDKILVGITEYAQKEISDVVFVELPTQGQELQQGKPSAVVESVKAAFDIYAPASGNVEKVNSTLENNPGMVNQAPYGEGWFYEMKLSNPFEWDALMSSEEYQQSLNSK